jgi:hypothetical protein
MSEEDNIIIFDVVKEITNIGTFNGSIISKYVDPINSIIFSDNLTITEEHEVQISQGLIVGFEKLISKDLAFSKKSDYYWEKIEDSPLEYAILISDDIMEMYDEGQFSDTFPYTINMLHTAGLYLKTYNSHEINHIEFFQGEILKNPVSLIDKGICIADRVVIDHRGDPVFYDSIIVGRNEEYDLEATYEPLVNIKMDDDVLKFIIILGIENLKE